MTQRTPDLETVPPGVRDPLESSTQSPSSTEDLLEWSRTPSRGPTSWTQEVSDCGTDPVPPGVPSVPCPTHGVDRTGEVGPREQRSMVRTTKGSEPGRRKVPLRDLSGVPPLGRSYTDCRHVPAAARRQVSEKGFPYVSEGISTKNGR